MSKAKSKIKSKSKINPNSRKKVVSTTKQVSTTEKLTRKKLAPTKSRKATTSTVVKEPLLFGKQNYIWMGIGLGLITLGLIFMSGGSMPSPDVWDENIIYGFRRTVLAPFLMLVGLVVEVYAIFKK